jgi:hypothetical protein
MKIPIKYIEVVSSEFENELNMDIMVFLLVLHELSTLLRLQC